jgi:hypothetical protein
MRLFHFIFCNGYIACSQAVVQKPYLSQLLTSGTVLTDVSLRRRYD